MLQWLFKSRNIDVLLAKKQYARAIEVARELLKKEPDNKWAYLKLADALALSGDKEQALWTLNRLANEYARTGGMSKSIAILKRIERLDPSRATNKELAAMMMARPPEVAVVQQAPARAKEPGEAEAAPGAPVTFTAAEKASAGGGAGIHSSPLFSDFSEQELEEVIKGLKLQTYEPGEIIVGEGEPGDSLFVMTEGTVRVYVRNEKGKNVQVASMTEGDFFGEISILTAAPRTATITAATNCDVLEMDRATLDAICEKQPRVLKVLEEFARRRKENREQQVRRNGDGTPEAGSAA